jgi:hypothetical protein
MKLPYHERSEQLATPLLKRYAGILLGGCPASSSDFLRGELQRAGSNEDVMRLRGALFECMAMHLGEAEAMERIRSLDACA